ncbi:MAG: tRNA uridine-5-carboxymethylaminomethyl(34) synthesis GTPase MnmE [Novosphingobium sp.]
MTDTIFALSSGSPPAAIAVLRISGPRSGAALTALTRRLPPARRASMVALRHPVDGDLLDRALALWFPGPASATGEDLAELHLHGGRAVVAAVERALGGLPGLRPAEAGEFTRRAFVHGRLDLAEAEGLADLLAAETELQRRSALTMASGELSRRIERWRDIVLELSAAVEAVLDFSDEEDIAELPASFARSCAALADELDRHLARPRAELLREGFTVVLAGPPNSGKSTLFNALTDSEAAITSPLPGTTRDLIARTVALDGVPFRFIDTAGLRDETGDPIERIGIERAQHAITTADLVLWLGSCGEGPAASDLWEVAPRQDALGAVTKPAPAFAVSAVTGAGIDSLRGAMIEHARRCLPQPGEAALNRRQHGLLRACAEAITEVGHEVDPLLIAEHLRAARASLDALLGRSGTEAMLDALFGRFCIGK